MPNVYATAHIDGAVICSGLSLGILTIGRDKSPVVSANMIAGSQTHNFWALDRLAVVVYCYVQAAEKIYPDPEPLQANLAGVLISNQDLTTTIVVARSITWHTSESIRKLAERLIIDLTDESVSLTSHWPGKKEMSLPVNGGLVNVARTFPKGRNPHR